MPACQAAPEGALQAYIMKNTVNRRSFAAQAEDCRIYWPAVQPNLQNRTPQSKTPRFRGV